jgi:hypothetical protein
MKEWTMKKSLLVVGLFLSVICLSGCNVVGGGGAWGTKRDKTIARIDAVDKLKFERDRRREYKKIAGRDGISPDAQVYLVKTVFDKLTFENAKEEVLLALIKNPSFCDSGEKTILDSLDKLAFESSKQKILKAISERKIPTETGD